MNIGSIVRDLWFGICELGFLNWDLVVRNLKFGNWSAVNIHFLYLRFMIC